VWVYHIGVLHLSLDEYLGCFDFSSIMNNVAMSVHIQVFGQAYVFSSGILSRYVGVKLLGCMVNLCLIF